MPTRSAPSSRASSPRVAVVLAGCGRADGSEIHESVSVLVHLSRLGAAYACFAPDAWQADVVNHATGKPTGENRNAMVEAARISRGEIAPLSALRSIDFDAVVFPGGYGAAKNLCSFAADGPNCTVIPDAARVLREFHAEGKPIGMCCIAPMIAAKVLGRGSGGPGCTLTIGDDPGASAAVSAMGATNLARATTEAVLDEDNRLATTPAYMCDAPIHEVFEGIGRMCEGVVAWARTPRREPSVR